MLSEKAVQAELGDSIIPIFRLMYAQMAGALAVLSKAIHSDLHHTNQVSSHCSAMVS